MVEDVETVGEKLSKSKPGSCQLQLRTEKAKRKGISGFKRQTVPNENVPLPDSNNVRVR